MLSFRAEFTLPFFDYGGEMAKRRVPGGEVDSPTSSPPSKGASAARAAKRSNKAEDERVGNSMSEDEQEDDAEGKQKLLRRTMRYTHPRSALAPPTRRARTRTSRAVKKSSPAISSATQTRRPSRRLTSPLVDSTLPSMASSPSQTEVSVRETRTRRKK